ncbi:MAG: Spy/CpxP family protein refolding chaperone [Pseudomonadota bacterium]
MKYSAIALLAALALAAATSAFAGPGGMFGGPRGGGPERMLEHMADYLDFDATQRASMENILEAARPEIQSMREQMRVNRHALETLNPDDPAYDMLLNDIAISNGELAAQGTFLFTRIRSEVNAILTDEQREKLKRKKERMKERMEERFQ